MEEDIQLQCDRYRVEKLHTAFHANAHAVYLVIVERHWEDANQRQSASEGAVENIQLRQDADPVGGLHADGYSVAQG